MMISEPQSLTQLDGHRRRNASRSDGRTPLYWAVRNNHADCAEALLRAGADPNLSCISGRLRGTYELAVSRSDGDTADLTLLHQALDRPCVNVRIVQLLIELGRADVNARTPFGGLTPMHLAARWDHVECMVRCCCDGGGGGSGGACVWPVAPRRRRVGARLHAARATAERP